MSCFITALRGAVVAIFGFAVRSYVDNVRAAKLDHIAAPAPYFPSGSIWTKDVSHAPLDPRSAATIGWLESDGGWGHGRMQIDFSLRVLQANATTPMVPFHKGDNFYSADSDSIKTIPLPAGGGIEWQTGYEC